MICQQVVQGPMHFSAKNISIPLCLILMTILDTLIKQVHPPEMGVSERDTRGRYGRPLKLQMSGRIGKEHFTMVAQPSIKQMMNPSLLICLPINHTHTHPMIAHVCGSKCWPVCTSITKYPRVEKTKRLLEKGDIGSA